MESPHDFVAVDWDHEPDRPPARPRPPLRDESIGSRTSTRTRTNGRFMESPHDFVAVDWDLEPLFGVPPSGGSDRLKPGDQTVGSWAILRLTDHQFGDAPLPRQAGQA